MELRFNTEHRYRFDEAAHITPNSEIYRALDLAMNRNVAFKKTVIKGTNNREKEISYRKAMQEVKTMVQISELTAKIPVIYNTFYDSQKGELYIAMQWINGETLADKMKRNIPMYLFLSWMEELSRILEVMSKRNFQHKDIKPENIMFNENGDLYLIDFNISVSVPNQMEGTMFYKAPEMDFGSTTVARDKVDMFSMGVMLYQQCVGRVPMRMADYECYDPAGGKWDMFNEPKALNTSINDDLNRLITRLMAYNPKDRFRNYHELTNELKKVGRSLRNAGNKYRRN